MRRLLRCFVIAVLAAIATPTAHAQDKPREPKVVLDLDKPAPKDNSSAAAKASGSANAGAKDSDGASADARTPFRIGGIPGAFGEACKAFNSTEGPNRRLDKPVPIADLFGAPIAVVKIRRYDASLHKPELSEARARVAKLLHAQTDGIDRGILWSEAAFAGLVAITEFPDHTQGVLEESGGHVCFSDHAGTVWYLRIPPDITK
jgi:hypothetical protein